MKGCERQEGYRHPVCLRPLWSAPSMRLPPTLHPSPLYETVGNGVEVGTYEDTWHFLREHGKEDAWL